MLVFVDVENTNTVSYFKAEFCFKVYLEMFGFGNVFLYNLA